MSMERTRCWREVGTMSTVGPLVSKVRVVMAMISLVVCGFFSVKCC